MDELKARLTPGVSPAMATPLNADGHTVNTAVVPQLVDFLLNAGVKGLFIGGTTGEGILLDLPERLRLHETAVAAMAGRGVPLVHVGANRLDTAVALAQHAAALATPVALVAVTPSFYPISDEGLLTYYAAIAKAAPGLPIFAYDIPHLAVNGISPAFLPRLCQEVPSLVGLKTSRPDAQAVRQLLEAAPPHLTVLAGNEAIALGLLALGAHGLISGLSTAVPEPFVALTHAFAQGDLAAASREQERINALLKLLPGNARIGAMKGILQARGIPVGTAVPPHTTPDGRSIWEKMQALL